MKTTKPASPDTAQGAFLLATHFSKCFSTGIILLDGQKKISALNPEASQLLGLEDRKHIPAFGELPHELRDLFNKAVAGHATFHECESVITSGALKHPLRVHIVTTLDAKKEANGYVIVLRDLTALAELENGMHRLDRLATVGTLSASMAHEIKNALVPVKTFVDLLLEKNQDAELGRIVSREMDRIDAIVSQMLKFGGRAKPELAPTNLHELLEHALRLIQHQLDGKRITVERVFKAATATVRGDAYQLEQAFINLFFNALEAMRPHGELGIATEIIVMDDESQLRISIHDTGGGIAEENLPQLFEPFFTTKKDGTGLGLSITRSIITEHRGTITVESEAGKGTTFHIHFPLR